MKKIILIFCFLLLILSPSKIYSQIENSPSEIELSEPITLSCIVNGITITGNSYHSINYQNPTNSTFVCAQPASFSGVGLANSGSPYGFINFTFSTPITSAIFTFGSVNCFPGLDKLIVSVNNEGILNLTNACGFSVSGNVLTCNYPLNFNDPNVQYGNTSINVSSTIPFTTVTFLSPPGNNLGGGVASSPCRVFQPITCLSGNNSPILSSTSISNICPNSVLNLNNITASNQPANTNLSWHTSTPANGTSLVSNPTNVTAGTYYAAYYDAVNNCYSPTSVAVTATVNTCVSDLQITKSISSLMPAVGSNVTFTLTATNIGPSNASGVVVTDIIPSGYTFVSATSSVGSWSIPNWTIGNLTSGATVTMTITATVNGVGSFTNRATITGNQTDPVLKNNSSSVTPKVIYAAPDNFSINSCTGGTTASVLGNDMVSGSLVSPANVTITLLNNNGLTGATINTNGTISVPAGTPPNTYQIRYRICQTATGYTSNCSEAIATVVVGYIPIIAVNDNYSITNPINTLTGGTTPSILSNDTLNNVVATSSNVTIVYDGSDPEILPPPIINIDGTIEMPQGLTIGNYTIYYTIKENGCLGNMSSATVTILVNEQVILTPQIVSGTRANSVVEDIDIQVDTLGNAKIIISGQFTAYNNVPCYTIARLNSNLTLDTTTNFEFSGPIPDLYSASDMKVIKNSGANYNKILLVGRFDGFSGGPSGKGIVRLMADGTLDTSFNAYYFGSDKGVSGSNSQIYCCYVYPDDSGDNTGKILIGGMFNAYNGEPRYKIARLNVDGSLDYTFNPNIFNDDELYNGPGFTSAVTKIVVQPLDQRIIVGGYFKHFNGVLVNGVARLNDDGTIDSSFNSGNISSSRGITKTTAVPANFPVHIQDILLQDNGSIIIGGQFTRYNGSSRNNIARLFPTGALDTTFAVNTGFNTTINPTTSTYGMVRDLDLEGTGVTTKVYVSGDFTSYQGVACDEIIKLNNNGFRDTQGFGLLGNGTNGTAWCMKRQNDGKMIIGGMFTAYNGIPALNITRILPAPLSGVAKTSTIYYDIELDATELENDEMLTIFPNPTTGLLKVTFKDLSKGNIKITIFSVLGQKVFDQELIKSKMNEIDLSGLRKGTYFGTFTTEKTIITKTVIIK